MTCEKENNIFQCGAKFYSWVCGVMLCIWDGPAEKEHQKWWLSPLPVLWLRGWEETDASEHRGVPAVLLELGVGLAQGCSRGVPPQLLVLFSGSLAGEQCGSSLIEQCLREKRPTYKLAIRCDFTGAQEHDLFLSIFIFAWLMSLIPHRKADCQWEGLQCNPFALGAVLQSGIAEAQAQTQRVTPCLGVTKPFQPVLLSQGEVWAIKPSPQSHKMPRNIPCLSCAPTATRGQELSTGERGHQVWQPD